MKKEVGSISQRYGSGDPDLDLHQNGFTRGRREGKNQNYTTIG
jgi:hypothetical protein